MVKRIQLNWPTNSEGRPISDVREFPVDYVDSVLAEISKGNYLTVEGAPKLHAGKPVTQLIYAAIHTDPERLRQACASAYRARFREDAGDSRIEELPDSIREGLRKAEALEKGTEATAVDFGEEVVIPERGRERETYGL